MYRSRQSQSSLFFPWPEVVWLLLWSNEHQRPSTEGDRSGTRKDQHDVLYKRNANAKLLCCLHTPWPGGVRTEFWKKKFLTDRTDLIRYLRTLNVFAEKWKGLNTYANRDKRIKKAVGRPLAFSSEMCLSLDKTALPTWTQSNTYITNHFYQFSILPHWL